MAAPCVARQGEKHGRAMRSPKGEAWWARRDSNPQAVRHKILNLACLPISPLAREDKQCRVSGARCQDFAWCGARCCGGVDRIIGERIISIARMSRPMRCEVCSPRKRAEGTARDTLNRTLRRHPYSDTLNRLAYSSQGKRSIDEAVRLSVSE